MDEDPSKISCGSSSSNNNNGCISPDHQAKRTKFGPSMDDDEIEEQHTNRESTNGNGASHLPTSEIAEGDEAAASPNVVGDSNELSPSSRKSRFAGRVYRLQKDSPNSDDELENIFESTAPNAAAISTRDGNTNSTTTTNTSTDPDVQAARPLNAEENELENGDVNLRPSSAASTNTPLNSTDDENWITEDSEDEVSNYSFGNSSFLDTDDDDIMSLNNTSDEYPSDDSGDNETQATANRRKDNEKIVQAIFDKTKPKYAWSALPSIYYREHGLTGHGRKRAGDRDSHLFGIRATGSLHTVERLELLSKLEKHAGCVNGLNFNDRGNLLATASDDLKVIIWKWATKKAVTEIFSGHNSNVFQAKFVNSNGNSMNLVSAGRDGQIRYITVPGSGGRTANSRLMHKHSQAVHKLTLVPNNPFEVLSVGEEGDVVRCDFRECNGEKLLTVQNRKHIISLYSICHHPMDAEFCVTGRDQFVRVYDRRNLKTTARLFCPGKHLKRSDIFSTYVTCAVYNYLGNEILASYSDDIYLFNNKDNLPPGGLKHIYSGHRNSKTIKSVNFFGPRSEFIVSGSDCGNCFFWDKESEAIVQWVAADDSGPINCLEPHPNMPVLATSGLDHDIKMWIPSKDEASTLDNLKKCVKRNIYLKNTRNNFDFFDDTYINYFVRQRNSLRLGPAIFNQNSDDDDDDDEYDYRTGSETMPCMPS